MTYNFERWFSLKTPRKERRKKEKKEKTAQLEEIEIKENEV